MKAIILAAGEGSRLRPLTETTPKPLTKILWKPLICYSFDLLKEHVNEFIVVVQYKKELFYTELWDAYEGVKISYHEQGSEKWTGGAVKGIQVNNNEDYLIIAGDQIFFQKDINTIMQHNGYAALAKHVDTPEKYGIFETDENWVLKNIVEKPTEHIWNLANISFYKVPGEIFPVIDTLELSKRWEIEITDAVSYLTQKHSIQVFQADFIDIGYAWNLLDANKYLLGDLNEDIIHGTIEGNVSINGNIILEEGAVIKSGTYIEGNCYFGKNTVIWPNAYIRGNTSLWDGGKIGFSVEVKNSYLWENSKIPHLSYLWDSVVWNNVNLWCGFKVANLRHDGKNMRVMVKWELVDSGKRKLGCIIGDGTKTAINTQVYPGRVIPTNGATLPGEIVK